MIFDWIAFHNFGLYKGHQTINLAPAENSRNIILFGGKNGSGKTTFLDAIHLVLYGKLAHCSGRRQKTYDEFLLDCINSGVSPKDGASIEIRFRHASSGKQNVYELRRSWWQSGKSVNERFYVHLNGKPEPSLSETWPSYVENLLPNRISDLFFFDGEQIEKLADLENSGDMIASAINSLIGLDIVDKLKTDIGLIKKRKAIQMASATEKETVADIDRELKQLESDRTVLLQNKASLNNDLIQLLKENNYLEKKYRDVGGELLDKKKDLESRLEGVRSAINLAKQELCNLAGGEFPLILVKDLLKNTLAQVRKEQDASHSKTLVQILEERDKNILKKLSHSLPPKILSQVNEIFDNDRCKRSADVNTQCYLNVPQETSATIQQLFKKGLDDLQQQAKTIIANIREQQNTAISLERLLAAVPTAETIKTIHEDLEKTTAAINKLRAVLAIEDERIEQLSRQFSKKQNELNSAIKASVERNLENEDKTRITDYADKAITALDAFHNLMLKSRLSNISDNITSCYKSLLRKKTLVDKVKVLSSGCKIEILGQNATEIDPSRLSAGERQLLAVSILWGLARTAAKPLPTAIDTPLGRLDSDHRINLVERYFPFASHQILLFSTDEEIDQRYHDMLKRHIAHEYLLDYDDLSKSTIIQKGYFFNGAS